MIIVYALVAVTILGVLAGLHQIITYQAEIAFEEFDSKQKSINSNVLQPTPKLVLENKTVAEKEK